MRLHDVVLQVPAAVLPCCSVAALLRLTLASRCFHPSFHGVPDWVDLVEAMRLRWQNFGLRPRDRSPPALLRCELQRMLARVPTAAWARLGSFRLGDDCALPLGGTLCVDPLADEIAWLGDLVCDAIEARRGDRNHPFFDMFDSLTTLDRAHIDAATLRTIHTLGAGYFANATTPSDRRGETLWLLGLMAREDAPPSLQPHCSVDACNLAFMRGVRTPSRPLYRLTLDLAFAMEHAQSV